MNLTARLHRSLGWLLPRLRPLEAGVENLAHLPATLDWRVCT